MILCFQVTVRDDGRPPLSSTTRVVIEVADINDHGPEFEAKFYTVQIPASLAIDKPLFQVSETCLKILSCIYHVASSQFTQVSCKYISTSMNGPSENKAVADPQISPKRSPLSPLLSPRKKYHLFPPRFVYTCAQSVKFFNPQCDDESPRDISVKFSFTSRQPSDDDLTLSRESANISSTHNSQRGAALSLSLSLFLCLSFSVCVSDHKKQSDILPTRNRLLGISPPSLLVIVFPSESSLLDVIKVTRHRVSPRRKGRDLAHKPQHEIPGTASSHLSISLSLSLLLS